MLSPRWRKVVRDLWGNKSRTILVVLSIAIGVIAFGGLFTTRTTIIENVALEYNDGNQFDVSMSISGFDDALVDWAERQPNITGARGVAIYSVDLIAPDGTEYDTTLSGVNDFAAEINVLHPETGTYPPGRNELVIERSFVEKVGVVQGDTVIIEVDDEREFPVTIAGTVHDINVEPGLINDVVKVYGTPRTLFRMGLSAEFNTLYLTIDRSTTGFFGTEITDITDQLRDDLTRMGYVVRSVTINQERGHWANDNLDGMSTILVIVGFLALVLSGFLVVNTIAGFLAQQRKTIGIMKIIGANRAQIMGVYLVMVASMGVLALVLAVPLSGIVGQQIALIFGPGVLNFDIVSFQIPVYILLLEIAVAFLAPILAALSPIYNGTRISAAAAISDMNTSGGTNPIDVFLARLGGLPRPVLLAVRNTFRRKLRLFLTMITLVLAGAFFIAIVNVRAAVQDDVGELLQMADGDIRLIMAGDYDQQALERRAEGVSGISDAEGWLTTTTARLRPGNVQGEDITTFGVFPDSEYITPYMVEGRWLDPVRTQANRYDIVIGDELVDAEPDVGVGDTLTLRYQGREQDFNVIGVVWSKGGATGGYSVVYAHYETIANFTGKVGASNFLLTRTDGTRTDDVIETDLLDLFEAQGFEVGRSDVLFDLVDGFLDAFDVIITLLLITAVMIAVVGGLGLAGTMSLSVLERTREVGVMRSVGAGTNTLRGIFIMEGIMIGLLSYVFALVMSVPSTLFLANVLGQVVRDRAFSFAPTWDGIVYWLGIVLVVSAIASLLPANRASEISIREALAYE